MDNSAPNPGSILDRTAVALSGLCLLHCLALPFVIVLLPVAGQVPAAHWHAEMLLIVLPVSVVALAIGYRRHGNLRVIAAGTLGMLLLVVGGTIVHARYGIAEDRAMTVAGSLVLAIAHFFNTRFGRYRRSRAVVYSRLPRCSPGSRGPRPGGTGS